MNALAATVDYSRRRRYARIRPTPAQIARSIPGPYNLRVLPDEGLVIGIYGAFVGRLTKRGYIRCRLSDAHGASECFVHRVIWEAVNGPISPGLEINHINGIKTDNRIENLELVTHAENMVHAVETGLRTYPDRKAVAR